MYKWFQTLYYQWDKYVYTVCILAGCLNYGITSQIFAACTVDFKFMFHTSMAKISITNTFSAAGYLAGALFGFSYKYINRQLALTVLTALMAVTTIVKPMCNDLWLFYLLAFIYAVGGGAWDSGNQVWSIEIWGDYSPAILQLQQMMYGLGTVLAPLIAEPYLFGDLVREGYDDHHHHDHDHHHHTYQPYPSQTSSQLFNMTYNTSHYINNNKNGHKDSINYSFDRRPSLEKPFLITGAISAMMPIVLFVMFIVKRYKKSDQNVNKCTNQAKGLQSMVDCYSPKTRFLQIILFACIFNAYSGVEQTYQNNSDTYNQYLPDIEISAKKAANILAVMTATYTAGPLLTALFTRRFSPEILITYHMTIILASLIFLQFSTHSITLIWIANVIIGYGMSSMYPSLYAFTDKHLILNNKITAITAFFSGLFPLVSPFVIGANIEKRPQIFLYLELAYTVITIVIFIFILFVIRQVKRKVIAKSANVTKL